MSEMIERVDRAIVTEIARQMREGGQVHYDLVAVAAIKATFMAVLSECGQRDIPSPDRRGAEMSELQVSANDPAWSDMTKRVAIEIAIVQAREGSLIEQAQIAIQAMREPTGEMISAGCRSDTEADVIKGIADTYRFMIDRALK